MTSYDAIVIGAGHNGLTCAAYLAKAGRRVLVLEADDAPGGTLRTEEFHPGFHADVMPRGTGWLNPQIARDLSLYRHGLELIEPEAACFTPLPDGGALTLWRNPARTVKAIRAHSPADADHWQAFSAHAAAVGDVLRQLAVLPPPDVHGASWLELGRYAPLALKLRGAGNRQLADVLRSLPMSAQEFLDEWFESDALKGTLGMASVLDLKQGVRSAGTAYLLLHHHIGAPEGVFRAVTRVRGGIGRLASALAEAARAAGADIRTGAEVVQILVEDEQVTGIALADGEEIAARTVISGTDPQHTFLDLIDPVALDPAFIRQVRNIRYRGVTGIVHLALDGLPHFGALAGGDTSPLHGVISISPSLDAIERAYDDAKHGGLSMRPIVEAAIPSLTDPSLAPDGHHVMTLWVQFAPFDIDGGWTDALRESLGDRAIAMLAEAAPNLPDRIIARRVLTPADLEADYRLRAGSFSHGEMTLDQFSFMRPVPGWSQYRTPLGGLFLCSAGTHPGGGHTGAAGYVASPAILREREAVG